MPLYRAYPELERYSLACWACDSETFFDVDEEVALATPCWRCGAIINGDL